jgi:hypothetical protein
MSILPLTDIIPEQLPTDLIVDLQQSLKMQKAGVSLPRFLALVFFFGFAFYSALFRLRLQALCPLLVQLPLLAWFQAF